jgi:hypothetical protein
MITLLNSPRAKNEHMPGTPRITSNAAVVIKAKLIDVALSGPTAGKEDKEEHQGLLSLPCELRDHGSGRWVAYGKKR